ncbi:MAG: phosphodiester glycosidase family protein [Clostridia bacterium]|nr:phosphodiester glycosidase family protein [Clostridia bacterium]
MENNITPIPPVRGTEAAKTYKVKDIHTSPVKRIFKFFGKFFLMLLTLVIVLAATLFVSLKLICSDAFPASQQMFVTTILETGQLKFLASLVLPADKIQSIVDKNSMGSLVGDVDTGLINIGATGSLGMPGVGGTEVNNDPIEVHQVSGATFYGTMLVIKDPSRISLATIFPWREEGETLDSLVKSAGAIGGINGGLYDSTNNTGGAPFGVVVSNGEIQFNNPTQFPGLVLIGFTEDNILEIIDINKMSASTIEKLIRDRKIRDAVTFQEEASDSNNHFVQLILNGEAREMNGMGSGLNPRTAIGQRADGAVLMFVTDGRGKSGHLGASAADLISVMSDFGAVNAANLDGGSSSCMYYDGEYLMSSVTFYYTNSSWKLPTGFIIK